MFRHAATIAWIALSAIAAAEPKIALVRVAEIHRQLDSTKEREAAIKAEREAVGKDARLRAYHSVLRELEQVSKKLKVALEDTENPDASIREGLKREYSLKLQEASTLHKEYEAFRNERLREINAKMVSQMEASLAEIHQAAAEVGKKKGFDWVIDSSGQTNTGVPFVLYAKNPTDLTSDVLAELGQTVAETADSNR
ncbi:MAG: OmpH family outer membrane protein [Verrucomicrobiota bacterium]